jgi:hypothetical protein
MYGCSTSTSCAQQFASAMPYSDTRKLTSAPILESIPDFIPQDILHVERSNHEVSAPPQHAQWLLPTDTWVVRSPITDSFTKDSFIRGLAPSPWTNYLVLPHASIPRRTTYIFDEGILSPGLLSMMTQLQLGLTTQGRPR